MGERNSATGCITLDQKVYLWGSNYKYKLGNKSINGQKKGVTDIWDISIDRPIELQINQLKFNKVICGGIHNAVIDQNHNLWIFGCGSDGRLGHPEIGNARYLYKEKEPVMVQTL